MESGCWKFLNQLQEAPWRKEEISARKTLPISAWCIFPTCPTCSCVPIVIPESLGEMNESFDGTTNEIIAFNWNWENIFFKRVSWHELFIKPQAFQYTSYLKYLPCSPVKYVREPWSVSKLDHARDLVPSGNHGVKCFLTSNIISLL